MKLTDRTHTLSQYFTLESLDTIGQSGFDGGLALELDRQDGETIIVEAGEDHHTRNSAEGPLAAAWWLMDRQRLSESNR